MTKSIFLIPLLAIGAQASCQLTKDLFSADECCDAAKFDNALAGVVQYTSSLIMPSGSFLEWGDLQLQFSYLDNNHYVHYPGNHLIHGLRQAYQYTKTNHPDCYYWRGAHADTNVTGPDNVMTLASLYGGLYTPVFDRSIACVHSHSPLTMYVKNVYSASTSFADKWTVLVTEEEGFTPEYPSNFTCSGCGNTNYLAGLKMVKSTKTITDLPPGDFRDFTTTMLEAAGL